MSDAMAVLCEPPRVRVERDALTEVRRRVT